MERTQSVRDRIYLSLRGAARNARLSPALYRPIGSVLRTFTRTSDTLVEEIDRNRRLAFVEALLACWEDDRDLSRAPQQCQAIIESRADEPAWMSESLQIVLRDGESRAKLRLLRFLTGHSEPALRQPARLLLAGRAGFWRDFRNSESYAEAYLADPAGQSAEGIDLALRLLAAAKRRLGKIDEALAANDRLRRRRPLDTGILAERAQILAHDRREEMLRHLTLCDAPDGKAGPLGNALYLLDLCERGTFDEVERIARRIEAREPPSPLARAFLSNALIARDGDPSALPAVLETLDLDGSATAPDFDRLDVARAHELPAEQPLVSVVMTAYNAERYIPTAIASILGQSYGNLELIVVDDRSTDATAARIGEIAERDPRLRSLQTARNSGTYVAKNEGIRAARGDFVALCDSDDVWTPDHAARHVAEMLADPGRLVSSSDWLRLFDDCRIDIHPAGSIVEVCPHSTFFRRAVFERVGYFDSVRFGADREFISRIALECGSSAVHHIPEVLTLGRRHEASLTTAGAGRIDANQKSDLRLAYWGIWNDWQTRRIDAGKPLYNSGLPEERPYEVPPEMQ